MSYKEINCMMQKCKIKSIKKIGHRKTYNLTMKSSQHNYAIFDNQCNSFIISKNSHSVCYGYNSYLTAYLKANYPDEFVCSLLNVTIQSAAGGDRYEKAEAFEKEFKKKMNIKFLPRDINKCKVEYRIEKRKDESEGIKKSEIRPSLLCKGLSSAAAQEIENNQPFNDMVDFVSKINVSIVDSRSVEALIESGYFGKKAQKEKEKMIKKYLTIRDDIKKSASRGIESVDLFGKS